jgi:ketosteroid isomerase-like protein
MNGLLQNHSSRLLLLLALFLIPMRRLPAPIQEVPETPAPKPAPARTSPKRSPKPKVTPPDSSAAKMPSPSPQSKSSPPEAAVSSADQAAITGLLSELENKWESSIASHAVAIIDSLIADDYVSVSSTGKVLDKPALLEQLKNDGNRYDVAEVQDLNVRVVRPDFALVTGLTREKGKTTEGKTFDRSFRFTDTWTKRDGQWRCTNAQVVKVSDK